MWQGRLYQLLNRANKSIELGGQVVDKGKEIVAVIDSVGKFVDKVNPLNNIGFYVILTLSKQKLPILI